MFIYWVKDDLGEWLNVVCVLLMVIFVNDVLLVNNDIV